MAYREAQLVEETVGHIDQLSDHVDEAMVTWINVDGLGDANTIRKIGEQFGLHALALEDVINVHQRAKVEPYSDHLFIVTRLIALIAFDHLGVRAGQSFSGKELCGYVPAAAR